MAGKNSTIRAIPSRCVFVCDVGTTIIRREMNEYGMKLADRVADIIEFEPELWDQTEWGVWPGGDLSYQDYGKLVEVAEVFEKDTCKTTACVAGWGIDLAARDGHKIELQSFGIAETATNVYGFSTAFSMWLFDATRTKDEVLHALRFYAETGLEYDLTPTPKCDCPACT